MGISRAPLERVCNYEQLCVTCGNMHAEGKCLQVSTVTTDGKPSMGNWTCYVETPAGGVLIEWDEAGDIWAARTGAEGVKLPRSEE
tara:strand:+ start:292 stop:549 length:258 start_codon:yes stop_codon:yes gene_type:complete